MTSERNKIDLKPSDDGVTHVNVYTRGRTALGRSLSNLADIAFEHPTFGRFRTMEGLWFWLALGRSNDMFRMMDGYNARRHGSDGTKVWVDGFQDHIRDGITAKIVQNPELREMLCVSYTELPFFHYYCYGKGDNVKLITPKGHEWQMLHIEKVRKTLIANPNDIDSLWTGVKAEQ